MQSLPRGEEHASCRANVAKTSLFVICKQNKTTQPVRAPTTTVNATEGFHNFKLILTLHHWIRGVREKLCNLFIILKCRLKCDLEFFLFLTMPLYLNVHVASGERCRTRYSSYWTRLYFLFFSACSQTNCSDKYLTVSANEIEIAETIR